MGEGHARKTKVTVTLDTALADRMRDAVDDGLSRSQSALVQESVTAYLAVMQEERLRREYADAARDPRFLKDIEAVMRDFRHADAELGLERDEE